jgi:hypothetical protein
VHELFVLVIGAEPHHAFDTGAEVYQLRLNRTSPAQRQVRNVTLKVPACVRVRRLAERDARVSRGLKCSTKRLIKPSFARCVAARTTIRILRLLYEMTLQLHQLDLRLL